MEGEDVRGKEGNGVANACATELEVLEATDAKDLEIRVCRDAHVNKRVRLRKLHNAPSAPNKSYSATLRMFTVDASGLRAQNHRFRTGATCSQSARSLTSSSRSRRITTSLNAHVIPPPVSGCRIFHESPRRNAPSRVCFPCCAGGMKVLGIRRRRSASRAFCAGRWSAAGSWGMILFKICSWGIGMVQR